MNCTGVPKDTAKEAIERTQETELGHAFLQCEDGSTSKIISRPDDIAEIIGACDGVSTVFYTRPDNIPTLTKSDRRLLHKHDVEMVCVGVELGGEAKAFCERSEPSCTRILESDDGRAESKTGSTCPFQ
jgi:hypothetical protein